MCNASDFQKRLYFDYIGRLISGYEISELFTNEERMEMIEIYQKRTKEVVSQITCWVILSKLLSLVLFEKQAKFSQILAHVEDNLRVALCISPRDSCYSHLPQYPTIFKFASILWYTSRLSCLIN